jgi:SAM-dependent methyltransferase
MQAGEQAAVSGQGFPPRVPCPVGSGEMRPHIWLPHVWTEPSGRPFAIYWSEEAGLGRLVPTPTPEELSRWYATESYQEYMDPSGAAPESSRPSRPALRTRLLFRLVRSLDRGQDVTAGEIHRLLGERPGRICDVGCGSGMLLGDLHQLGHTTVGIEPSEGGRAATRARGAAALAGTAEELPSESPECPGYRIGGFDVVVMIQSLEHCLDPMRAMQNVFRLLKPGGWFVCEVPNAGCVGFQLSRAAWYHTDAGRHLTFFTRKGLSRALEQTGFAMERVLFSGYTRQFAWLNAEQEVWDRLFADSPPEARAPVEADPPPPRPSERRQWALASRTLLGPPERRYDSIRIHARKPLLDAAPASI